jgi:plasmid stabilization system protein ParE
VLVVFRAAATLDVEAAYEWYESQRRGLGGEFRTEVDAAVELISGTPLAFPLVRRNIRRALLRRFPYALYYRIVGDQAVVEACIHGKRHPRAWRSRV